MDKIYIEDELPKCCLMCTLECPEEQRCVDGFTRDCENCDVSDRPKTCPLRPLSKRLAEERKKVVEKIIIKSPLCLINGKKYYEVEPEILNQIERGSYE